MSRTLPPCAAWLAAVLLLGGAAQAQQTGPVRANPDSLRQARDSTRADTVVFAPPDSAMRELLRRAGYNVTRYQGDSVVFSARDRGFFIRGAPAGVARDSTRISGDSIGYSDLRQRVSVWGSPGMLNDPSNASPIRASGPMVYYLGDGRATASRVCTEAAAGSVWYLCTERGGFVTDSTRAIAYMRDGWMTTDPDSVPHYQFRFGEVKQVSRTLMVARPAILKVGEVPVMWLPWLFQDMRSGRRSGILTPRFGISEVVRNSPSYRRTVENLGYYFALSDYYDAQVSFDWRSAARPSDSDPGWTKWRGQLRYAWLDRFLTGNIGLERTARSDGTRNLNVQWGHQQRFSQATQLTSNINYSTSTQVERQTALNPAAAVGTIGSQLNLQTRLGPFATSIGGSSRQYLGREQLDLEFPSLSVTSGPIELQPWLVWTPSLRTSVQQSRHIDTPSEFAFRFVPGAGGTVDSVRVDRGTRTSSLNFGTPFKVGGFNINATFGVSDRENDFPEAKIVINPADTSQRRTVVYERTYLTAVDWDFNVNLPSLSQGAWNLTPSVSLRNVDPSGFWVRSERTGADFVGQTKRVSYGLSVSPTFYRLVQRSIGPIAAFRHSITPAVSYSYSPTASVSDEFLAAVGRVRAGYLGALAQNRVSLTLGQTVEAKLAAPDTATDQSGRKIKLLSLQFTALEYDFERARATGRSGFSSERFGYSVRSDLVPGLDVNVNYSLFEGSLLSDTARFAPYRESITATMSFGGGGGAGGGGVSPIARAWAWLTGEPRTPASRRDTANVPQRNPLADPAFGGVTSAFSGAFGGGGSRAGFGSLPTNQGFRGSITLSSSRQRPPVGGNIIVVDPRAACEPLRAGNPLQYEICLQQQTPPNTDLSYTQTTPGGPVYQVPAQTSLRGQMSFSLTQNWAADWQTMYDLERGEFASQIISLQRELKDWRAAFGFTQAPNGNFAFTFLLSLKPAPDIQIPYESQSYRSQGVTGRE